MRESYGLPAFLGRTVPVEFAAELAGFRAEEGAAVLRCATDHYEPVVYDYYGTRCETVFRAPGPGAEATLRLDFASDEILRLRHAPGPEVPEGATPMVLGRFDGTAAREVRPRLGRGG